MKTPTNIGGNNLITWLQTATEIRMADLYTIALKNGTVLRYTTWDNNVTVEGSLFLAGPPHIKRSSIEEKLGLDVSSLDLEIAAGLSDTVKGVPVLQLIAGGAFDGAALTINRLFMDSAGNQIGTAVRFSGTIGAVDEVGRASARIQVHALTEYLQMSVPRNVIQPACMWTLFDSGCTLRKKNLLEWSENVGNSWWEKGSASISADSVVSPIGDDTADTATFSATGLNAFIVSPPTVAATLRVASQIFTFSAWLKVPSGTATIQLWIRDQASANLAIETVTVTTEWQRFSVTQTMGASSTSIQVLLREPSVASDYHVWGAQCEYGPEAGDYEKTTSSPATMAEPNVVQAGSTVNKVIAPSAKSDGFYDNGQIVFTSGANNGLTKAVKGYSGQQFFFNSPLPSAPVAGDTFVAYPGCDKTQATCAAKFNNLANFGGIPYVPAPETAI